MSEVLLLEQMSVYKLQTNLSDELWEIVSVWNYFAKDTIGKQLTRAFDSIGANIAEGYGRFNYGEKITVYFYARGSAYESQYWIKRAKERRLLENEKANIYLSTIQKITTELNRLIKTCKDKR